MKKTLLVKCLLAEDLGVTWFAAVCFLCGARVALYCRFVCCFTQRTGIFFPWTSEYELLPFSCMRIWNISSLSSSTYVLLVPVCLLCPLQYHAVLPPRHLLPIDMVAMAVLLGEYIPIIKPHLVRTYLTRDIKIL